MLVPSIGTGPVHDPMVLDAADSTVRLMLSLNVNVARWRGGASPSRSCALVMNCGAGTMQEDHTRSLLKSQGSSGSCRQDTALGVHCLSLRPHRGGGLEEEPGGRAVLTKGTRICRFSTHSRTKKCRRSMCLVREWNSGLYEMAMAA